MKNIIAIIQARMSSTRLPAKVLLPIGGKPVLEYVIARTRQAVSINNVVIATTKNAEDNAIVDFCKNNSTDFYRGDLHNVLDRYFQAAKLYKADVIIRVTSDCPLVDGMLIDRGLQLFRSEGFEYVSNTVTRTFPRGFDFEIFTFDALKTAHTRATDEAEKEHVTPYIWRNHPQDFKIAQVTQQKDASKYRITIDTPEDFEVLRLLIEKYGAHRKNASEIIDILDQHPEIARINEHIEQKQYGK